MEIKVSAVLSIHNRIELLRRALESYAWQTLPKEAWEIVLVDDMSTRDLKEAYGDFLGKINLRHVRIDHTRHFVWKERNPGGPSDGSFSNWYHTPAISINVGSYLARGSVLCLCHPEIIHKSTNFEHAAARLKSERRYLFGTAFLGTQQDNAVLASTGQDWAKKGWGGFFSKFVGPRTPRYSNELYWYVSFLPRQAVCDVGGVDFVYLHGVAGEDDDFRERVKRAGYIPIHAQEIEGFHQDHSNERENHRDRKANAWRNGLERNRSVFFDRRRNNYWPVPTNVGCDWTAKETIISVAEYRIGSSEPHLDAPWVEGL